MQDCCLSLHLGKVPKYRAWIKSEILSKGFELSCKGGNCSSAVLSAVLSHARTHLISTNMCADICSLMTDWDPIYGANYSSAYNLIIASVAWTLTHKWNEADEAHNQNSGKFERDTFRRDTLHKMTNKWSTLYFTISSICHSYNCCKHTFAMRQAKPAGTTYTLWLTVQLQR